ncbi:MAG: hypothetical protein RL088_3347 [Verrucomicrobiota bacterium]|jgi:hypothetical protein
MLVARIVMGIAAIAYFLSAMEVAPLMFAAVGASMDRQHEVRVQMTSAGVKVGLIHHDGTGGMNHGHKHQWPALVLVGPEGAGHGDHFANFDASETGVTASPEKIEIKCPVAELPAFEWLALVAFTHAPVVSVVESFEIFVPLDIRPTRPAVLLI